MCNVSAETLWNVEWTIQGLALELPDNAAFSADIVANRAGANVEEVLPCLEKLAVDGQIRRTIIDGQTYYFVTDEFKHFMTTRKPLFHQPQPKKIYRVLEQPIIECSKITLDLERRGVCLDNIVFLDPAFQKYNGLNAEVIQERIIIMNRQHELASFSVFDLPSVQKQFKKMVSDAIKNSEAVLK